MSEPRPQILMNDFKAEPAELRAAMTAAAARVFDSGWWVLGEQVRRFESAWAEACDLPHAVGVANGLDALEVVLRALGVGRGDEVVTTPMTAFATPLAVMRAGATPVFADIDPNSGLLSIESVRRCVTPRTKAVMLVHLYGQMRDMEAWTALAAELGIALIEDCAQSHLARWKGRSGGAFGAAGAYSFYPTKNLGAVGDAGAVVTTDSGLAERAARLRNYGQSVRYEHPEEGLNSRLDELQAAILIERLAYLERFTARRRAVAEAYRARIEAPRLTLLAPPQSAEAHVHHLFVVLADDREGFEAHMRAAAIATLRHYPKPAHLQPPCRDVPRDPEGVGAAEVHAQACVSLPCHPAMTDEEIDRVVDAANAWR